MVVGTVMTMVSFKFFKRERNGKYVFNIYVISNNRIWVEF